MGQFDLSKLYPLNPFEKQMKNVFIAFRNEISPNEIIEDVTKMMNFTRTYFNALSLERQKESGMLPVRIDQPLNYSEADAFHKGYDIIIRRHDRYYPIMIHSHDFYEIVCVVDGTGAQFIGTDRGILSRGDIVVIAPGTKHSIAFYEDNCIVYNLAIKLSTFETIFKELLANRHILTDFFNKTIHEKSVNSYVVFHTHDYLLGDNYLADIEQEFEGGRAYCADMLNTLTHLFFLHLMRNFAADTIVSIDNYAESKAEVIVLNYIKNHFRNITLSELGNLFGYSNRQISRIIKNATGQSFSSYIISLRTQYVSTMLEKTELTIAQIIELSGSTNQTHFYRSFKKEYGMTPAEYREKVKYERVHRSLEKMG